MLTYAHALNLKLNKAKNKTLIEFSSEKRKWKTFVSVEVKFQETETRKKMTYACRNQFSMFVFLQTMIFPPLVLIISIERLQFLFEIIPPQLTIGNTLLLIAK